MNEPDATELLAMVRDIHLPAEPVAPPVWPIALAVMVIALALLTLLAARRRVSWASAARSELTKIQHRNDGKALAQTASLLRRIVLTENNTAESHTVETHMADVQRLSGQNWLKHLDHFFNTRYFTEGDGKVFGTALYQANTEAPPQLYRDLKRLIRRRRWQQ